MNINDAQEIHRDIYSGMVVEKLAKEGYYSESVTFYGFLESYRGGGDKSLKMRKHVQRLISKDAPWVHWCRRLPPFISVAEGPKIIFWFLPENRCRMARYLQRLVTDSFEKILYLNPISDGYC